MGWRCWRVYVPSASLRSTHWDEPWPSRQALTATCLSGHHVGVTLPSIECTCGIWSYSSRDPVVEAVRRWSTGFEDNGWTTVYATVVVGQVSLWGTVIEHEEGWRASKAYPYSLEVPEYPGYDADEVARVLRDEYLVDAKSAALL